MSTQIQRRRGTTTEHGSFTGAAGEITVDTTKDTIVVHDGSTAGGHPLATEANPRFTGNVGIGISSPRSLLHLEGAPYITLENTAAGNDLKNWMLSGGSDGKFRLRPGTDAYSYTNVITVDHTGNVGIGTDSPQGDLHVGSTLSYTESGSNSIIANSGTHQRLVIAGGNSHVKDIQFRKASDTALKGVIRYDGNEDMRFYTNGTEKVRIESDGKVGIGSPSPQTLLHIKPTNNVSSFQISQSNSNDGYRFHADGPNGGHLYLKRWSSNTEDTKVTLLANGNVGIGTDSPGTTLELGTETPVLRLNGTNNGANVYGDIRSTGAGFEFLSRGGAATYGSYAFYNYDGTTESIALKIKSNGNVGIGTSSPTANLEIQGSPNPSFHLKSGNDTGSGFITFRSTTNTTSGLIEYKFGDNALCFASSGSSEKMRIDSSGNVGIGTSSPAAKLHVNGSIQTGGVPWTGVKGLLATANGQIYICSTSAGPVFQAYPEGSSTANITINSDGSIEAAGDASINSLTIGRGPGNVSTNTVVGSGALYSNASGSGTNNTAIGRDALYENTSGGSNTGIGRDALHKNTTGADNVATGYQSLRSNTTGANNTATGTQALKSNTTGASNTAYGFFALHSNTTGSNNTATGREALLGNTTGSSNVANGYQALYSNTTGYDNLANGQQALYYSTTGSHNAALGYKSLYKNTTGSSNTASGLQALYSNTTGTDNVANGKQALNNNTTGSGNTSIGLFALYNNTTGSGNIGIGFVNNASTYAPVFNPTSENNRLVLGHTAITNAYVQVAWTVTSDARDKMNFAPVPYGLDFVNQLKPTAYQFKVDRNTETPNGEVRYGFKAQDILALEGDNPVIIDTEDADNLKYKGEHLVPVLVNAVQELTAMVKELQTEIKTLKG